MCESASYRTISMIAFFISNLLWFIHDGLIRCKYAKHWWWSGYHACLPSKRQGFDSPSVYFFASLIITCWSLTLNVFCPPVHWTPWSQQGHLCHSRFAIVWWVAWMGGAGRVATLAHRVGFFVGLTEITKALAETHPPRWMYARDQPEYEHWECAYRQDTVILRRPPIQRIWTLKTFLDQTGQKQGHATLDHTWKFIPYVVTWVMKRVLTALHPHPFGSHCAVLMIFLGCSIRHQWCSLLQRTAIKLWLFATLECDLSLSSICQPPFATISPARCPYPLYWRLHWSMYHLPIATFTSPKATSYPVQNLPPCTLTWCSRFRHQPNSFHFVLLLLLVGWAQPTSNLVNYPSLPTKDS